MKDKDNVGLVLIYIRVDIETVKAEALREKIISILEELVSSEL